MKQRFFNFQGRLALFQEDSPDCEHWERRWSTGDISKYLNEFKSGKLDEFEEIFLKYLPRDLPIIEAGCGKAQLVMALRARGYTIEGVDYANKTIQRIKEVEPTLNVRRGDIYNLDVKEGHYGGYISIGLFEHNEKGPLDALLETQRVLSPNGFALITVPYLNHRRAGTLRKADVINTSETPKGLKFYQYFFAPSEFTRWVEQAGMEVVELFPYGAYTGLTRYSESWIWWEKKGFFCWPLHRRFIHWCSRSPSWFRCRSAHMMMYVCRRKRSGIGK